MFLGKKNETKKEERKIEGNFNELYYAMCEQTGSRSGWRNLSRSCYVFY
jgi:hypothetical protein